MEDRKPIIEVRDVTTGYGSRIIMRHLDFTVYEGEIFGLLGGSGCGKSTLLKNMIGLYRPLAGDIRVFGESIVDASGDARRNLMSRFGVTYQGGALFGSMTLAENVALPLQEHTKLGKAEIDRIVQEKLEAVDLGEYGSYMPAEISGGMKKRAGLARALALNPRLLFFDEPSAGLDPVSSSELDDLILATREREKATVVIVTHELSSIYRIVDRVIMLDKNAKTSAGIGSPAELRDNSENSWVRAFMNRSSFKGE